MFRDANMFDSNTAKGLGSFLASNLDEFGRNGDNRLVHMKTGELAVHPDLLLKNPELTQSIAEAFAREGRDMREFMVGGGEMSINPTTGYEEAFLDIDLVKGIKDIFKKAAPVLLPLAVNFIAPGLSPFLSGAIAGGVGSLIQGGDAKDAFRSALLGGTVSGVSSVARGGYFFKGTPQGKNNSIFRQFGKDARPAYPDSEMTVTERLSKIPSETGNFFTKPKMTASEIAQMQYGEDTVFSQLNPDIQSELLRQAKDSGGLDYAKIVPATLLAAGAFGAFEEIPAKDIETDPTSKELLEANRDKYMAGRIIAPRRLNFPDDIMVPYLPPPDLKYAAKGGEMEFPRRNGYIAGPGTETSDDIPAMLSDGEFVMTARAVRGAGGGDRKRGVANMYNIMRAFEGGAVPS